MVLALDLVPVNDTEAEGIPLKSLELGQRGDRTTFLLLYRSLLFILAYSAQATEEESFRLGGVGEAL